MEEGYATTDTLHVTAKIAMQLVLKIVLQWYFFCSDLCAQAESHTNRY